jgi:hypothetical protein
MITFFPTFRNYLLSKSPHIARRAADTPYKEHEYSEKYKECKKTLKHIHSGISASLRMFASLRAYASQYKR